MFDYDNFTQALFLTTPDNFESKALSLFNYQYDYNPIYRRFCDQLGKSPENTAALNQIPFLPIEFFKWEKIKTETWPEEKVFKSSGTTGQARSHHYIKDLKQYHQISEKIFEETYGPLETWTIFALLPSYMEQGDSSLISMVDSFMKRAKPQSNYYLRNTDQLVKDIHKTTGPKLLIGVTYALLDLIDQHAAINSDQLVVMETGGMKGRRKEMIREEVHERLKSRIAVQSIHSEYGMCELSSQAYGIGGQFKFPNWSKVIIRDTNDPLTILKHNETGGINVIDLGNINSCAFIATQDLGKSSEIGIFEVLGRFDNSDVRGCNLLV